ncbi:MAG: glycosyltransferase family 4 protein [Nanoarchaeota archaeon]
MKIAFICPYYDPAIDGPKQVIKELAARLVKDKHEVHIYTSDSDKYKRIKKKEEIIDKVHVHRCYSWFKVANFVTFWPSVFFKLMKEDFDVIHTHVYGHPHVFFASLAAKLKDTKLIHTTHCPWTDSYRSLLGKIILKLTYSTLSKFAVNLSDKVIAITPWESKFLKKLKIKNFTIIPNGVDNIFFKKIKNNRFKKRYNINGKIVLFFGRLNVTKGPDKFVLAAKEILKERENVYFVLVGPDEGMKSKLQKMIDNKNILLLNPIYDRKKITEMYQASDIFVMPSYREGLPLTLFEAMACGLPIIASPVNGIPYEMTKDNGIFVNYGDINGLKEAILKILNNPKLAKKYALNNKKTALKYKWDLIYSKTLKLYKEVLS